MEPNQTQKRIRGGTKRVEGGTKGMRRQVTTRSPCCWHREASADPAEQLRRATGREVGRSLEKEFGSLKPWSVGDGVEHWLCGACSEGGLGEAEGGPPPMW